MKKTIRIMAIIAVALAGFSLILILASIPFQSMLAREVYGCSEDLVETLPRFPLLSFSICFLRTACIALLIICCGNKKGGIWLELLILGCLVIILPSISQIISPLYTVLLSRMGISASIKGYHFIRRAVIMAVEDEEMLVGITKGLYPDIAKQYKTSASKVERAIRHAIESAWKKNGPQVYFETAGYLPSEKPTNGQFIAALSEYFRLQKEERPKKIS